MTETSFINITNKLSEYSDQIDSFVRQLDSEKEFFDMTTERVMRSELVLVAIDNDQVVGISGLERKFEITRSYSILGKNYQGTGLGKN